MDLQGGPTFEDLSINDELSQLERVVRYSSSSIALQRLVHVKMLAETVASVGFEQTVKSVVPLLRPLAEDEELVVRQHLGEQLDEIARFCRNAGKEAGYRLIIEMILPTLAKLLGDHQAEVRQAAGKSLVGVASLMKPLDLGHHVLTIVLQLAHDNEQEELRMTAAALLNDLAESLGNDLCKQFVTPEMESLSEDQVFRVRKATALNLYKICKVVGDAGIQRLLIAYVRLSKDDVYRVRKACTEALVEMSKAVGAEVSMRELTPVFLNLASDSSKLVRTGALQHLGRLISTLPGEAVSEDLVRYFTSTAVASMGDPVADAELRLYCAFSFPAVVITVGPSRWSELRTSFLSLLQDPSWSVRKTLSHSLHEVAKVLAQDDVEGDLVTAMEAFLRDMEDVRVGVIRHLGDFFQQLSPPQREKHLNVLVEILETTSPFNWRLRELLAQQLPRLAPLLTLDSVFFAVVPVAFGLLNDPVAIVRERTFEVVAPLLQLAGAHSGARQASMVSRVRELAHAHTYQARQMYVYICHSMACSATTTAERQLFTQEFVPSLAELARDPVVNVRIAMSRTLSKCPDWVMELPEIRRAIRHLGGDSNPDVRHFLSFLPPILAPELTQEEKVPWVDTSSVLSDESVLTQWSMSTQRSALSVGDFPPVRDVSSPNRSSSYKLGRQRSSSVESAGESGYSTTSSEGEGLRRLSSRRPPLPAGWGPPVSGPASSPGGAAAGASPSSSPSSVPASSGGGSPSAAAETIHECPTSDEESLCATEREADDVSGGVLGAVSDDGDGAGRDEIAAVDEGALPAMETLLSNADMLPPGSPKRRAASQDAVMTDDEGMEDAVIPPIVMDPPDDGSPNILPDAMAELSLGEEAEETLAEVNHEGMPPPTPLQQPVALAAGPLRPEEFESPAVRRRNSGTSRPFEEHAAVWTGDEDDDLEDVGERQRGELNLTPPPWDERTQAAAATALTAEDRTDEHPAGTRLGEAGGESVPVVEVDVSEVRGTALASPAERQEAGAEVPSGQGESSSPGGQGAETIPLGAEEASATALAATDVDGGDETVSDASGDTSPPAVDRQEDQEHAVGAPTGDTHDQEGTSPRGAGRE